MIELCAESSRIDFFLWAKEVIFQTKVSTVWKSSNWWVGSFSKDLRCVQSQKCKRTQNCCCGSNCTFCPQPCTYTLPWTGWFQFPEQAGGSGEGPDQGGRLPEHPQLSDPQTREPQGPGRGELVGGKLTAEQHDVRTRTKHHSNPTTR